MSSQLQKLRRGMAVLQAQERKPVSLADAIIASEPAAPPVTPEPELSYEERMAERREREEREERRYEDEYRSRAGDGNKLPDDLYRDPFGVIRVRTTGQLYTKVEQEAEERARVERIRGREHRKVLRDRGILED